MKKYTILFLIALCPVFLQAQVRLVNNGATIKVSNTANLKAVNGSITNKNSGAINNNGTLALDLDYTQNTSATYTGGANSWLLFEGGANQSILTDAASFSLARLQVNNGNRLVMTTPLTVTSAVNLNNNGSIELGTHDLVLDPSASISNFDENSYIVTNGTGVLQQEVGASSVTFPVGNSSYNPATLSNAGTSDNFQVRVIDEVREEGTTGAVLTEDVVDRTWMIDEVVSGGSDVTVVLQWRTADELTSFDRSLSGVARHVSTTFWDNTTYAAATNVSAGVWSQTGTGVTDFSPFIVRDQQATLPIELLSFTAERESATAVALDWSTATEINGSHFEVERMLDNEEVFSKVGEVVAVGNSQSVENYAFTDGNAYEGLSYYRLKKVDEDGTFEYSEIRAVEGERLGLQVGVFPNPVNDVLQVRVNNLPEQQEMDIRILNHLGQLVYEGRRVVSSADVVAIPEVSRLVPGSYYLQLSWAEEQIALPFVKQ